MLSAESRTACFINNYYHVIDSNPIPVASNWLWFINIIEQADWLTATKLLISKYVPPSNGSNNSYLSENSWVVEDSSMNDAFWHRWGYSNRP